MAAASLATVARQAFSLTSVEVSDRELLAQYINAEDESAFAAIIRRHGRVVLGVCRRVLGPGPDADDAFQAAFVVLARKASSIRKQSSLASWLHGVAHRVSLQLRTQRARRQQRESSVGGLFEAARNSEANKMYADPASRASLREMGAILDEELQRLPRACRDALVLCLMENVSHADAAKRLGCPLGTLKARVQRSRDLLRQRLERRGVSLTGIALSVLLAEQGRAAVSAALIQATLHGAAHNATSPAVAALVETLLATMTGKLKAMLAVIVIAGVTIAGVGVGANVPSQEPTAIVMKAESPKPLVQVKPEKQMERVDVFGDLLPQGALARLGTVRLRPNSSCGCVAFSPLSDILVSGGFNGTIQFWDRVTGKAIREIVGPKLGVSVIAFSPDGKLIAGHGRDQVVYVWDSRTGKELHQLNARNNAFTPTLKFSPNGELIAACDGHLVLLWEYGSNKLRQSLQGEIEHIRSVAFAPDGRTLAATDTGEKLHLWDTESGEVLYRVKCPKYVLRGVFFSQDGKYLLTTELEKTTIWEASTGNKIKTIDGASSVDSGALSPDGNILAIEGTTKDRLISLWNWEEGKQVCALGRRQGNAANLAFSRDGKTLAAGGEGIIFLWDTTSRKQISIFPGHQDRLTTVGFTGDGGAIVSEGWDGSVRHWDSTSGKELRRWDVSEVRASGTISLNGNQRRVFHAPDGKTIAVVCANKSVAMIDIATGTELRRFPAASVAFSPDGNLLACAEAGTGDAANYMGTIRIYDRESGKELQSLRGHPLTISSLTFTPDCRMIISTAQYYTPGYDRIAAIMKEPGDPKEGSALRMWSLRTGKEIKHFDTPPRVAGITLSPDGRTLAGMIHPGNSMPLWEMATASTRAELDGKVSNFCDVAFSPDGRTVALPCRNDGAVRLVDVFTGKELTRFKGHFSEVASLAFSPDGKKLVSGSFDTTALIWDVSRFTQPRKNFELTAAELDSCWKDLGGDAQTAFRAIGKLVDSPKGSATLLKDRLKPAPRVDEQRITSLIADLGSDTFKTREAATKELEKLGELAGGQLEKTLASKVTLEMKQRIEQLLDKLEGAKLPPEMLRQIRSVEVLEFIATPTACELLQSLVEGAPGARLTRESREAITRLNRTVKSES